MIQLLCVNVRKTCGRDLDAELVGVAHRISYLHTHEVTPASTLVPRSRPFATPQSLSLHPRDVVADWLPGEPLVLLVRGSAIDRVNAWLTGDEARELVSALVLLDDRSTADRHGLREAGYDGVVEFGRDAAADPGEKLLFVASASAADAHDPLLTQLRLALGSPMGAGGDPRRHIHLHCLPLAPLGDSVAPGELPRPFVELFGALLRPFLLALEPEAAPLPAERR